MNKKEEITKREREFFLEKFGTLKFTRFDPEIKAGKLSKEWNCPPYRINILAEYIKPLYEMYVKKVSPGVSPITDAQRFDFERIIILIAQRRISADEKIQAAKNTINQISLDSGEYVPYKFNPKCLFPLRAIGTIYQGSLKGIDVERT